MAAAVVVPVVSDVVYRLCTEAEWAEAKVKGEFAATAIDLKDGFMHLSSMDQCSQTAQKHFHHQNYVRLTVSTKVLGLDNLKVEAVASRGGELFTHYCKPKNATSLFLPVDSIIGATLVTIVLKLKEPIHQL